MFLSSVLTRSEGQCVDVKERPWCENVGNGGDGE